MTSRHCVAVSVITVMTVACILVTMAIILSTTGPNDELNTADENNVYKDLPSTSHVTSDRTSFTSPDLAKHVLNHEYENRLNATVFLQKTTSVSILHLNELMLGMTSLANELFIIRHGSSQIDVYDTTSLDLRRNITIPDSISLSAIVASWQHNCLYICDYGQQVIHLYNLSDNVLSKWSVGGKCYGLSMTTTSNILATIYSTRQLKEYATDGSLIREISLDSSIVNPYHSVHLAGDRFAVSHEGTAHRVCVVDANGLVVRSRAGSRGPGVGQFSLPRYLARDTYDNVLVADLNNNRVALLSPALEHLGYVSITSYELNEPWGLQLDHKTRRLYIIEWTDSGRVFILTV